MRQEKTICAVLFDYGQVLSLPADPTAWKQLKTIAGMEEDAFHAGYWKHRHAYDRGDLNAVSYWKLIGSDNSQSLTEEQVEGLIQSDVDLWAGLNTPMIDFAQALQKAGIKTGILSNIGDGMAIGLRDRYDWIGNFDHSIWSHEHNIAKPELEIYRLAAKGLGCEPENILFLDDRADNIAAARAVGMHAIQYDVHNHAAFEQQMEAEGFGFLLHPSAKK